MVIRKLISTVRGFTSLGHGKLSLVMIEERALPQQELHVATEHARIYS